MARCISRCDWNMTSAYLDCKIQVTDPSEGTATSTQLVITMHCNVLTKSCKIQAFIMTVFRRAILAKPRQYEYSNWEGTLQPKTRPCRTREKDGVRSTDVHLEHRVNIWNMIFVTNHPSLLMPSFLLC